MKVASPGDAGRAALVLPDYNGAYHDVTLLTRMIVGLAERMICGATGENEDADLIVWLGDRLKTSHERLDQAVRLVPQPHATDAA